MRRTERRSKRGRKVRQTTFVFRTWGGRREGAGRKPKRHGTVSHAKRPKLASRYPVHISLGVDDHLPSLRRPDLLEAIETCLREVRERYDNFRVVHYSIQDHHLHLVVEAAGRTALSRGMQGLNIRVAKRINKVLGRKGTVFTDRYHETILKSPTQTRNGISYVLLNSRRHASQSGMRFAPDWIDDCSSGRFFDGWRGLRVRPPPDEEPTVSYPTTWLASAGWRKIGLIPVDAVPGRLSRRGAR
jgi:REP element-mobilizing transposase RayT